MKGIYYRPQKLSKQGLAVIAVLAAAGWLLVQHCPPSAGSRDPQKLAAAKLAERGMDLIREHRLQLGHQFDPHFDPALTGMIGDSMSLVTSVPGNLRSKQTSVNPNFAAAVVEMLRQAGVERGDCVAVGCSGSFPALNLATYAALQTLGARPLIIASAGASQFGANMPDLTWLDMDHLLRDRELVSFGASASSLGGYEDCGRGMCAASRQLLLDAIDRNGLALIDESQLSRSIERRMQIYRSLAGGQPVAAYINVGGGAASVGRTEGKMRYRPGLNLKPPAAATEIDSVMTRFANDGVPLIHLVEVNQLAASLALPEAPATRPAAGAGAMFDDRRPRRGLALLVLAGLVVGLRCVVFGRAPQRRQSWLPALARRPALRLAAEEPASATAQLMV